MSSFEADLEEKTCSIFFVVKLSEGTQLGGESLFCKREDTKTCDCILHVPQSDTSRLGSFE